MKLYVIYFQNIVTTFIKPWISKQTGYERESESGQEEGELNYKSEAERTFLRFTADGRKRCF